MIIEWFIVKKKYILANVLARQKKRSLKLAKIPFNSVVTNVSVVVVVLVICV